MNELPENIFTIDFETTGVDAKTAHAVEVAIYSPYMEFETFIKPPIPIPAETSAIHHIIDTDVGPYPNWTYVKDNLKVLLGNRSPLSILVAHNAQYEKDILGADFIPVIWICTYKCALRVWPNAPAHKNEVLRYWLRLGDDRGRHSNQKPHSAMHDARVTFLLLQKLLETATIEQLVEWTEQPTQLPKMPMGKHFGQDWNTIPGPYLEWCCKQADMREDVKHCAKAELARRRNPNATSRSS